MLGKQANKSKSFIFTRIVITFMKRSACLLSKCKTAVVKLLSFQQNI